MPVCHTLKVRTCMCAICPLSCLITVVPLLKVQIYMCVMPGIVPDNHVALLKVHTVQCMCVCVMWLACLIAMSHGWRCKCKCVPCILPCLLGVPHCLRYSCTCVPCALPCLLALSHCWRYTNVQVHAITMPISSVTLLKVYKCTGACYVHFMPVRYVRPLKVQLYMCAMCITMPISCVTLLKV